MKHFFFYAIITCTFLSCKSQNKTDGEQAAQTSSFVLDINEFEQKIEEMPGSVLLDVRTKEEFDAGYIRNAVLLDFYEDFENKIAALDKNKTYFVYCKAGSRSASGADIMRKAGFKTVFELKGGIMAWENGGKYLTNAKGPGKPGMSLSDFQALLQNSKVILVDFNAKWCGPCKKMSPFLDELSKEFDGRAVVQKIDVDENKELVTAMDIEGLPLLILYKNGQEIWRKNSYAGKAELKEKIDKAIQ